MIRSFVFRSLGYGAAVLLFGCNANLTHPAVPAGTANASAPMHAAAKAPGIYSFKGSPDGADPWSGLATLPGVDAYLIGTTLMGGDANNDGTVYVVKPSSNGSLKETVVYTFKGASAGDGAEPTRIKIIKEWSNDTTIVALATTVVGGTSGNGAAVVLSDDGQDPNHDWTSTHTISFGGKPDGANPHGGVTTDSKGNVYGTTDAGGVYGAGTVYRIQRKSSAYSESVLYSFQSGSDGDHPDGDLSIDKKNALYGTTVEGGTGGEGTVFKMTPAGAGYKEQILYSFSGAPDGASPSSGVCVTPSGALYGTTIDGGTQNAGSVYELKQYESGYKESVLWSFGSVAGDGMYPEADVIVDKTGAIYGTTSAGGSAESSGLGTFFALTPSSKCSRLYREHFELYRPQRRRSVRRSLPRQERECLFHYDSRRQQRKRSGLRPLGL